MLEEVKNEGVCAFSLNEDDLTSIASVLKCLNDANDAENTLMFFQGEIKITHDREEGGIPYGILRFDGYYWTFTPSVVREFAAVTVASEAESDGA
jgi:hypothetical protein